MFRILASVLALAIASAPIGVAAQTSEPAGSPRVVYHPPAPEAARAERPRAQDTRRATSRRAEHARPVSRRSPPRARTARSAHTHR